MQFGKKPNKIILGIDPGSRVTGYGVIVSNGSHHKFLHCGCIKVTTTSLASRLQQIFDGLKQIIQEYNPDEVAIEQVFMHKNANSALKLGHARGAALVAVAQYQIPISEYSARQIKQSVVGYGAASKNQVQHMIRTLLALSMLPSSDAADALATALCHAASYSVLKNINQKFRRGRYR